jgi:hypothetical protein
VCIIGKWLCLVDVPTLHSGTHNKNSNGF